MLVVFIDRIILFLQQAIILSLFLQQKKMAINKNFGFIWNLFWILNCWYLLQLITKFWTFEVLKFWSFAPEEENNCKIELPITITCVISKKKIQRCYVTLLIKMWSSITHLLKHVQKTESNISLKPFKHSEVQKNVRSNHLNRIWNHFSQ